MSSRSLTNSAAISLGKPMLDVCNSSSAESKIDILASDSAELSPVWLDSIGFSSTEINCTKSNSADSISTELVSITMFSTGSGSCSSSSVSNEELCDSVNPGSDFSF